jgi:hypothetical protein
MQDECASSMIQHWRDVPPALIDPTKRMWFPTFCTPISRRQMQTACVSYPSQSIFVIEINRRDGDIAYLFFF